MDCNNYGNLGHKWGRNKPKNWSKLPYHFHIHQYNWNNPFFEFQQTPILKVKNSMYYITQTNDDIDFKAEGIMILYLELDERGNSLREIGLDDHGNTIHKFPGNYKNGRYGLFDLTPFSTEGLESDLSVGEFEEIWHNA